MPCLDGLTQEVSDFMHYALSFSAHPGVFTTFSKLHREECARELIFEVAHGCYPSSEEPGWPSGIMRIAVEMCFLG